jgi:hypothetical protein
MPLLGGFTTSRRGGGVALRAIGLIILLMSLPHVARAGDLQAAVTDGAITYTDENGIRKSVNVGRKCTDLWTAPDGSLMAFITIERYTTPPRNPVLGYDEGPIIEESKIYIARRSERFAPQPVQVRPILIYGREWSVFRQPSVSPDGKTLFFEVPDSVVASMLVSMSLNSGASRQLGDVSDYCVIWYGRHSGELVVQGRYISDDPAPSVSYRCYLRDSRGASKDILDSCASLEDFAKDWSRQNGASCTPSAISEWHH